MEYMKYHKIYNSDSYYISALPIDDFTKASFMAAISDFTDNLSESYDDIGDFIENGYTEKVVNSASTVDNGDMILIFSHDIDCNEPVGLAITFDKKFYIIYIIEEGVTETDLFEIFTTSYRI